MYTQTYKPPTMADIVHGKLNTEVFKTINLIFLEFYTNVQVLEYKVFN